MSAIFQQLRLRFKSQLSLGLIVGLGIISCWLVWTFWGRAQLIAIGLGLMLAVLIIFAFPRYAAAAIACFITAAPTLMLPKPLNLGLVVVLGIVIIRKLYKQDITWRITPFFIWCSLFFVWHLTSILWCGNYDYMGVGIHISAVLIMLVFSEIVRTNRDYEIMIYAASVGIIISFVSVIYGMFELYSSGAATQLAGNSKSIEGVRLFGFWNNANSMAYSVMPFTAISLGMLFRHSLHRWQRILLIIATVAGFISILVSLARGALICTAFIVFILILRSKRRWFILAAIGVAFLLTTVLFPTKVFSRFTDIASGKIDASIGERTVFLLGGIDMIIDSFPLGFGAGGSYVYQMDYIEHR
ncbi:MAG: O-antigen ligase family protein, partial [Calditrichota bacterium]